MSSTTTASALKRKKRDAGDEVEANLPPHAHYQGSSQK